MADGSQSTTAPDTFLDMYDSGFQPKDWQQNYDLASMGLMGDDNLYIPPDTFNNKRMDMGFLDHPEAEDDDEEDDEDMFDYDLPVGSAPNSSQYGFGFEYNQLSDPQFTPPSYAPQSFFTPFMQNELNSYNTPVRTVDPSDLQLEHHYPLETESAPRFQTASPVMFDQPMQWATPTSSQGSDVIMSQAQAQAQAQIQAQAQAQIQAQAQAEAQIQAQALAEAQIQAQAHAQAQAAQVQAQAETANAMAHPLNTHSRMQSMQVPYLDSSMSSSENEDSAMNSSASASPSDFEAYTHETPQALSHDDHSNNRRKKQINGPHRCDMTLPSGEVCHKAFTRPYDLSRHQETIHAAVRKMFKCEKCGENSKTFSRMDALSRHTRIKHAA